MVQIRKRRRHALSRWVQGVDFSGEARPLVGLHILVVEDDAANGEVIAELLRLYGARPQVCASAEEALETLKHTRPDVLLCDLRLPHMDGHGLLAQIRTLPAEQGGKVPAVAITGDLDERHGDAIASGFQRFFFKPIEWDSLVPALHELARSH